MNSPVFPSLDDIYCIKIKNWSSNVNDVCRCHWQGTNRFLWQWPLMNNHIFLNFTSFDYFRQEPIEISHKQSSCKTKSQSLFGWHVALSCSIFASHLRTVFWANIDQILIFLPFSKKGGRNDPVCQTWKKKNWRCLRRMDFHFLVNNYGN